MAKKPTKPAPQKSKAPEPPPPAAADVHAQRRAAKAAAHAQWLAAHEARKRARLERMGLVDPEPAADEE